MINQVTIRHTINSFIDMVAVAGWLAGRAAGMSVIHSVEGIGPRRLLVVATENKNQPIEYVLWKRSRLYLSLRGQKTGVS